MRGGVKFRLRPGLRHGVTDRSGRPVNSAGFTVFSLFMRKNGLVWPVILDLGLPVAERIC